MQKQNTLGSQNQNKMAVIGCGNLGLPLCAVLADAGYEVEGIDIDKEFVESLTRREFRTIEPNLVNLLEKNSYKLTFSTSIKSSQFPYCTFIIVPSPSDPNGKFSSEFVLKAVAEYCDRFLESDEEDVLLVIVTTVMPGTMNLEVVPLLESKVGTRLSQVKLFYSPEFIALGSVIKNLQYPDAILIGEANVGSAPFLAKVLEKTVKNSPEVTILNLVNAEVAKISVNAYVTMKISFANQLSEICQALPFGDADEVLSAIAKDSRIGAKYLHSAPAFGGPCFPRDNRAFSKLASDLGIDATLSKGTDQINLRQVDRLIEQIKELSLDFKSVVILGVSYKPGTRVFEESPSLRFFELLHEEAHVEKVSMYDPAVLDPEIRVSLKSIGNSIISEVSELKIALNEADAVYLFNNDDAFLDIPELIYSNKTSLFDLWGSWVKYRDIFHGRYYRLGTSTITRWKD